jgi:hypothetical protein
LQTGERYTVDDMERDTLHITVQKREINPIFRRARDTHRAEIMSKNKRQILLRRRKRSFGKLQKRWSKGKDRTVTRDANVTGRDLC